MALMNRLSKWMKSVLHRGEIERDLDKGSQLLR
jgi:hypothetical protein